MTNIDALLRENEAKDLLRFVTAGSVDDGKSTLIGRLLYESKGIYEDQLEDHHFVNLCPKPEILRTSQIFETSSSDYF